MPPRSQNERRTRSPGSVFRVALAGVAVAITDEIFYLAAKSFRMWWPGTGLNRRHRPFQGAVPATTYKPQSNAEMRRNRCKTGQSRVGIAGGVILRECTVSLDTPAPQGDRSREDRAGDRAKPSKRVRALSTPSRSRLRLCRPHRRSRCGRRNLCRCWPSCREVPRFLAWIEQLLPTSPEKTGRKPRMDQRPF